MQTAQATEPANEAKLIDRMVCVNEPSWQAPRQSRASLCILIGS